MRLKGLELVGYKTFASKTSFEFGEHITAIVGPNGSGKSNIADALRWVLGEQSYSLLRGKKTVDMIFSGSEFRSRSGMASAGVIFDNSDGWLPIDFSEVLITRKAYRDGQNEYSINGQRVRLRDISELLSRSGLSERTYTIIGQGLIDQVLSLKPEDRRKLFEEAAGIGLYRQRKEDALRRLENTRRNLERVKDILAEIKPRLNSLQRQARRTQEFLQIKTDLEVLLREWYGFHWHRSQKELSETREYASSQERVLQKARETQAELEQRMSGIREQLNVLRGNLGSWHRQLSQYHHQREEISRNLAVLDERKRSAVSRQGRIEAELARMAEEVGLFEGRLKNAEDDFNQLQGEVLEATLELQTASTLYRERVAERSTIEKKIADSQMELNNLRDLSVRMEAQVSELEIRQVHQEKLLEDVVLALRKAETRLIDAEKEAAIQKAESDKAESVIENLNKKLQFHLSQRDDLDKSSRDLKTKISAKQADAARLSAQLEVLEQAEKALAGYAEGAKFLLKAGQQGKILGLKGALSSLIEVEERFETAVAAALGEFMDAVVIEETQDTEPILELMEKAPTRAFLLPLNRLVPPDPITAPNVPGCFGIAADLVRISPGYRPIIDIFLGNVWLVEDRATAMRLIQDNVSGIKLVTLAGEVFWSEGQVSAGGMRGNKPTISRPRRRRELENMLVHIQDQVKNYEASDEKLSKQLAVVQQEIQNIQRELDSARKEEEDLRKLYQAAVVGSSQAKRVFEWQRAQRENTKGEIDQAKSSLMDIQGKLISLQENINRAEADIRKYQIELGDLPVDDLFEEVRHWETQLTVLNRSIEVARTRKDDRSHTVQNVKERLSQQETTLDSIRILIEEIELNNKQLRTEETQIAQQIAKVQALIDPAEISLAEQEDTQTNLLDNEAKARKALTIAERYHSQAQIGLAKKQEALETLRNRIEDDFGLVEFEYADDVAGPTPLPLDGMVEHLPRVDTIPPELGESIKRMRSQLRRMGAINPEAQKEFEEVKERFEFLTNQVDDLSAAEGDIKEVITELDVLMEREFRTTFDSVAKEFKETFTRLFGGGTGRLVLTNPDDLTLTGVDIEARLPGRRAQGLSLLSGGERSLTASALIFAILKVSPTPFCVLDEVDAMLDEINVNRFADMLQELSRDTQFVVITHNRNTVQVAEVIYGITMARDSTSQVLSLKMDEVVDRLKA